MDLKSALATGKRVALGLSSIYYDKAGVNNLYVEGSINLDDIVHGDWRVETAVSVTLTDADFKELWDEVAAGFTSVKTYENSVLAKKLLERLVATYR